MRKFIVANISSYIGQCVEAEHYYCTIYKNIQIDIDKNISVLHHCRTSFEKEELTAREREVLELICNQNNTSEIAERLYISPRTVEVHRNSLLIKTGSQNIAGLVVYAIQNKIVIV